MGRKKKNEGASSDEPNTPADEHYASGAEHGGAEFDAGDAGEGTEGRKNWRVRVKFQVDEISGATTVFLDLDATYYIGKSADNETFLVCSYDAEGRIGDAIKTGFETIKAAEGYVRGLLREKLTTGDVTFEEDADGINVFFRGTRELFIQELHDGFAIYEIIDGDVTTDLPEVSNLATLEIAELRAEEILLERHAPAKPESKEPQKRKLKGTASKRIKHVLTDKEVADLGREQSAAAREKTRLEDDKKSIAADYKLRIDGVSAKIKRLGDAINDGWEWRDAECSIVHNDPAPGLKTYYRVDTGEKVETIDMSPFDKQMDLPLGDESKAEEKPVVPHRQTRGGVVACDADGDDLNDHSDDEDF